MNPKQQFLIIFSQYEGYKYIGVYKARTPSILLRDPELIKEVLVKNFNSFHDNETYLNEKLDPIVSRNPFFLRGHRWKVVRSQVTSAITTGKVSYHFLYDKL